MYFFVLLYSGALNTVHVSQLLHCKAGLLQNDGIILYTCRSKQTHFKWILYKSQNNTWPSVLSGCIFHYITKFIQKMPFPSTHLNVNLVSGKCICEEK